jgi:hypothetical protein
MCGVVLRYPTPFSRSRPSQGRRRSPHRRRTLPHSPRRTHHSTRGSWRGRSDLPQSLRCSRGRSWLHCTLSAWGVKRSNHRMRGFFGFFFFFAMFLQCNVPCPHTYGGQGVLVTWGATITPLSRLSLAGYFVRFPPFAAASVTPPLRPRENCTRSPNCEVRRRRIVGTETAAISARALNLFCEASAVVTLVQVCAFSTTGGRPTGFFTTAAGLEATGFLPLGVLLLMRLL